MSFSSSLSQLIYDDAEHRDETHTIEDSTESVNAQIDGVTTINEVIPSHPSHYDLVMEDIESFLEIANAHTSDLREFLMSEVVFYIIQRKSSSGRSANGRWCDASDCCIKNLESSRAMFWDIGTSTILVNGRRVCVRGIPHWTSVWYASEVAE
ncbi:hypothetical protein B0H10DRAFT_1967330 [Mycena sp. CBHHK59/15]|nr:hypothetical protein B0H10DRAFT_1967330 [Mycena sp. CBHHK59/15]